MTTDARMTAYKVITMEVLLRKQAAAMLEEASTYRRAASAMTDAGHIDRLYAKGDALETWAGKILQSIEDLTPEQREQNIEVDRNF